MIGHHEGGIHMAEAAAERTGDAHIRWLARQMARNQRREILEMRSMLSAMPRGI